MNIDAQPHSTLERRGPGHLERSDALVYERTFVLLEALSSPRLWQNAVEAARLGAEVALVEGREPTAFLSAMRTSLLEAGAQLIERHVPDVAALVAKVREGRLELAWAGELRAYRYRDGDVTRLTGREAVSGGLAGGSPTTAEGSVQTGDVLLFGTESAFSERSVAAVSNALAENDQVGSVVLVRLLTAPAAESGVGASAIAVRIR